MTDSRRPVPSKQTRPNRPIPQPKAAPVQERWVDLREAEDLTGIPWSTIRNWARKGRIDSRFEMDESGDRRHVEITEVVAWADHLGRQHKKVESRESPVASGESRPASTPAGSSSFGTRSRSGEEIASPEETASRESQFEGRAKATDIEPPQEPERTRNHVSHSEPRRAIEDTRHEQPATRDAEIPEGTMLVPLDAWNKMLNQLGNLHEAGQQLAEARERAAKAETEVQFLRERLTELRTRTEPEATEPVTADPPAAQEGEIEPLWVDLYRRWKRRR
jgi:hypothetical protein